LAVAKEQRVVQVGSFAKPDGIDEVQAAENGGVNNGSVHNRRFKVADDPLSQSKPDVVRTPTSMRIQSL